jgi:hypothetical protein
MKHSIFCTLLCFLFCITTQAATNSQEHVFVFERSTNGNYVCYDINLQKDGSLYLKKPLRAYWLLDKKTHFIEDSLTFLDRKMAFGVKVVSSKKDEALVHLTAYKGLTIRVCKHKGKWVGIVQMNGHELVLQKMFAQMKPPIGVKCEYVDIYGTDINTGEKRRERIKP